MLLGALVLLAGLAILVKAADAFVLGASRTSLMLRLSPVVVGAVVLGFGTSAPELLVSALAAGQGSPGLAAGNVVGSNVANLTLVAGIGALVAGRLVVTSQTLRREAPLAAGAAAALALALQGGLSRWLGVVLLLGLVASLAWILVGALRGDDPLGPETEQVLGVLEETTGRREAVRTTLGLLGTALGAQLVVFGARRVSDGLGLDEGFVGFTIVAIGTSLPEVVTAIQAARRGESHLVVGNLFGSNIFNSLGIGGVIAVIAPGPIAGGVAGLGSIAMVVTGVLAWYLMGTRCALVRWEALALLAAYAVLLPFLAR